MIRPGLSPFGTYLFWLLIEAKKNERGPGEARLWGWKILPGVKRRCGDFLAQTWRARPCLPQRFTFADTKAKMNGKNLLCMRRDMIWLLLLTLLNSNKMIIRNPTSEDFCHRQGSFVIQTYTLLKPENQGFFPKARFVCATNVHLADHSKEMVWSCINLITGSSHWFYQLF